MSSDDDGSISFDINLEEVNKDLIEIEKKYSPLVSEQKDGFEQILHVLSKKFDCVGLPPIDFSQSWYKIFKQITTTAHSLIDIHRNSLKKIQDCNIDMRCKSEKNKQLDTNIESQEMFYQNIISNLEKKISKLKMENEELVKKEVSLKKEFDRARKHHAAKENELVHHIKKLTREFQGVNELLAKGKSVSRDEASVKLLTSYRKKEETYKSTIQKLQENNKELLEEIYNLREEIALSRASINKD